MPWYVTKYHLVLHNHMICVDLSVDGEDDDDDTDIYSSADDPNLDQPVYQDIDDSPTPHFARPNLQQPISKAVIKSAFSQNDIHECTYEEPVLVNVDADNNYHMLADNGTLERSRSIPDQWYDDMGISDGVMYDMNKHPPPVWKPKGGTLQTPPPLPPDRRAVSSEPEERPKASKAQLRRPPLGVPLSPNRSKPLPPPKPKTSLPGSPGENFPASPMKDLFGIRDNPKFKHMLHEKRQELYGDSRGRSFSTGDEQECYDEVTFAADDPNSTGETVQKSSRPPSLPNRDHAPPRTRLEPHPLPKTGSHPLHSSKTSPQHQGQSGDSTPTSPPPLPSRELVNPAMPSFSSGVFKEAATSPDPEAPPVPLRESSRRTHAVPPAHDRHSKRRNSLPSPNHSPTPFSDRAFLPLPTAQRPGKAAHAALANILSKPVRNTSSSPQHRLFKPLPKPHPPTASKPLRPTTSKPLPPTMPPEESLEGYEDVNPDQYIDDEVYDDVIAGPVSPPPAPPSLNHDTTSPSSHSHHNQLHWSSSCNDIFPVPQHPQGTLDLSASYDDTLSAQLRSPRKTVHNPPPPRTSAHGHNHVGVVKNTPPHRDVSPLHSKNMPPPRTSPRDYMDPEPSSNHVGVARPGHRDVSPLHSIKDTPPRTSPRDYMDPEPSSNHVGVARPGRRDVSPLHSIKNTPPRTSPRDYMDPEPSSNHVGVARPGHRDVSPLHSIKNTPPRTSPRDYMDPEPSSNHVGVARPGHRDVSPLHSIKPLPPNKPKAKPQVAKKPTPAKKPPIAVRKPAPPTQPRVADSGRNPPPPRNKVKPLLPKKPIPS